MEYISKEYAEKIIEANKKKLAIDIAMNAAKASNMSKDISRLDVIKMKALKERRAIEFKVSLEMLGNIAKLKDQWYAISLNIYNKRYVFLYLLKNDFNEEELTNKLLKHPTIEKIKEIMEPYEDKDLTKKFSADVRQLSLKYLQHDVIAKTQEHILISLHAYKRYLQRIKKTCMELNQENMANLGKEILGIIKEAKLFYYQEKRKCQYFLYKDICICIKNDTVITLWRIDKASSIDEIKEKIEKLVETQNQTLPRIEKFENKILETETEIEKFYSKKIDIEAKIKELKQSLNEVDMSLKNLEQKRKNYFIEKNNSEIVLDKEEKKLFCK